jgi:peptidoglycan/LPS O-acetylase OafA/YrhL
MEERERDRMIAEGLSNIATGALLTQGPLVLIGAVGLWFAFATRGRHAYVSAVAAVGFGLLIVFALSQVLIQFLVVRAQQQAAPDASAFSTLGLWSYAVYLLLLGGIAFIARAVFIERD